jgi:hypothetical protein
MMVCYTAMLFGVIGGLSGDGGEDAALALAAGLAGVPAVFLTLAFVSRHPRAPRAALNAMALFLVVGFFVSLLSLPAGLVSGFGAGGVVAFRLDSTDTIRARVWAVALSAAYVLIIGRIVPPMDALAGSLLPLIAIGGADTITRRRVEQTSAGR